MDQATTEQEKRAADQGITEIEKQVQVAVGEGILSLKVDTELIKVSEVITVLSSRMEITDISVGSASLDDVVVSLYKQYEI